MDAGKNIYAVRCEEIEGIFSYDEMEILENGRVKIWENVFSIGDERLGSYWWLDETTEVDMQEYFTNASPAEWVNILLGNALRYLTNPEHLQALTESLIERMPKEWRDKKNKKP